MFLGTKVALIKYPLKFVFKINLVQQQRMFFFQMWVLVYLLNYSFVVQIIHGSRTVSDTRKRIRISFKELELAYDRVSCIQLENGEATGCQIDLKSDISLEHTI